MIKGFIDELVRDLTEFHALYVHNTQSITGLCLPMPKGEPSAIDYLC
jgi:hypothetical protein